MDLKTFALKLREELLAGASENSIVAKIKIKKAEISLTDSDIEIILRYIEYPQYDPQKGLMPLNESDNSELLDAITIIRSKINGGK